MAHLPLSCGETGGEPGRVLGSYVTHVLHTAGMQKQTNKQTNKRKKQEQLRNPSLKYHETF